MLAFAREWAGTDVGLGHRNIQNRTRPKSLLSDLRTSAVQSSDAVPGVRLTVNVCGFGGDILEEVTGHQGTFRT